MTGEGLAAINATFNATSATLIVLGFVAIRARKIQVHRALMVSAFISSSLFLVGYLTRMAMFGSRLYAGDPAWKTAYLVMLFSHMILAADCRSLGSTHILSRVAWEFRAAPPLGQVDPANLALRQRDRCGGVLGVVSVGLSETLNPSKVFFYDGSPP